VPAPAPGPRQPSRPTTAEPKDSFREVVETVVFVVVLVLLLKSFLAEAFVIPTGSMATTLYGYHRLVTCPQCGHQFAVNVSKEVEGEEGGRQPVTGCTCPNCRFHIELRPRNAEGKLEP
jgi:signal peptidase I